MDDDLKKMSRNIEAVMLAFVVILITLLHYSTIPGNVLLHEISQRLYYVPIVYAAYSFSMRGALLVSLFSGIIYYTHISSHAHESARTVLNQYAEILMFQVVAIVTGYFASAERQQRQRFEKASKELAVAYQELKDTVNLLMRAARLKSLGELAASIAHEIRNPLGAIKGAVEIIESEIPSVNPKFEFVEVMKREVERLNRLLNEFLKFARPRAPEKSLVDINDLIKSVINFLATQAAKSNVKIIIRLDEELPLIEIDSEQIRQVLVNLIINAIQAMPAGGNVEIGSGLKKDFVHITVRDYGTGIEADKREKIFDPFFTTKEEGSGLGLAITYQLVKQHGGEIELIDVNGSGSLFEIRLPIAGQPGVSSESEKAEQEVLLNNE